MVDYVHSHSLDILNAGDEDSEPVFLIPPGADLEAIRGGPEVVFDGLMPRAGRYRAWTQFRRGDVLHTFTTTFEVREPARRDDSRLACGRHPSRHGRSRLSRCRERGRHTGPSPPRCCSIARSSASWSGAACRATTRAGSRFRFPPTSRPGSSGCRCEPRCCGGTCRRGRPCPATASSPTTTGLTPREAQFLVSWVEGLGPRNAGTTFLNVPAGGQAPAPVRASARAGAWQLGQPDVVRTARVHHHPAELRARSCTARRSTCG